LKEFLFPPNRFGDITQQLITSVLISRNYACMDRRGGAVDIGTALAPDGRVFFSVPVSGKGFSIFQFFQTNVPLLSVSTGFSFQGVKAAVA